MALIEELGLKKEECLYLGDTNTDMKTGQAAKVDTVGVTWGFSAERRAGGIYTKACGRFSLPGD